MMTDNPDEWMRLYTVLLDNRHGHGFAVRMFNEMAEDLFPSGDDPQSIAEKHYAVSQIREQIDPDRDNGEIRFGARLQGRMVTVDGSYFIYRTDADDGPWVIIMPPIEDFMKEILSKSP